MWQSAERAPRRALLFAYAIGGIATLMLGACAGGPDNASGNFPAGASAGRGSQDMASSSATMPIKAAAPSERGTASAVLPAAPKAPAAPHSLLTPARLKGYTAAELKAVLGDPTLLRRDGPAELWQYAGSGCVLHVFLYDEHGVFRVSYSEVRIDDADVANPPACVEGKDKAQARSGSAPAARASAPSGMPATPVAARSPGGI